MGNKTDFDRKPARYSDSYSDESDISGMISSAIAQKKKKKRAKKRNKGLVLGGAIGGAVLLLGIGTYVIGWVNSMGKFLPNTYINDTDVSGMNPKQAAAAIQMGPSSEYLVINGRNSTIEHIPLDYFNYEFDVYSEVKKLFDDIDYSKWFTSYFKNTDYYTECEAQYDAEKLEYILRNTIWGDTDTADAKLRHGEDGYYIQPEVYGDTVDIEKLVDYVITSVNGGTLNIDLTQSSCYSDPTVFAEDLTEKLEDMNKNFNFTITYDFDYAQEILTGADIYEWMDDNGNIDRSKAEAFIASLAAKYDTFMKDRSFRTTERGVITMSQGRYSTGQYGWWIDQEKSVEKLLGYIEARETKTVDPMYVTLESGYCYEGYESGRTEDDDIGTTYIEVDLSNQKMWYYRDSELLFETDQIVSGKATDASRKTPGGVYSVYTKSTNYTMVAADGSYTAKCSYFMRCSFEGIGFHDLSRGAYGGDIYINNGSHGCINMKYSEVKQLYDLVERGTPVIMYY
ncbi:MAG: L,D-transpeptidase family protein [Oscillospiraceae bacterium]|nr:L,D-transpeptidase family protein [Oscillospiraceae bacterium]